MMPELGKYALTVSLSYLGTILPLAVLTGWTLWRGAKVKRALAAQEERMKKNG
ncbi:MAG: heme exporter protein CcmD [Paracoccaceae bacterium]|jgi:heme exporter protein D